MAGQVRVDDVEKLAQMLTTRDKGDQDKAPDFADPSRYVRHTAVDDAEALAHIAQLDAYIGDMRALMRKAEVLDAKMTITRNELYSRLEETYPQVLVARRGGTGLRDWKGAWWYVGWDHQRYQGENADESNPGDGRGQYL